MDFKDRLRQLREERGLSQQELGQVLMLSKANISKFETGKLQPSLQHVITLVQYFAISAEFLLGISEQRNLERTHEQSSVSGLIKPSASLTMIHQEETQKESDPFRQKMTTILTNEYTDIEKDILSRCLTYGLKQIEAIRNERMGYQNSL